MNKMNAINFAGSMMIIFGLAHSFVIDLEEEVVVTSNVNSEKKFADRYVGVDGEAFFGWPDIFKAEGQELRDFCVRAHKAAGMGDIKISDGSVDYGLLMFNNKSIHPSTIPVMTYITEITHSKEEHEEHHDHDHHHYRHSGNDLNQREPIAPFQVMNEKFETETETERVSYKDRFYFFITKGTREDCVFYLDRLTGKEYQLEDEVCGITRMKLPRK